MVRDLSKFAPKQVIGHANAMKRVMKYNVTEKYMRKWSGNINNSNLIIKIIGTSDSDYAKDNQAR
jgi:hypothetical protein